MGKHHSAKKDAQDALTAEKTTQALVMRRAGATYEQIGQQLGCSLVYAGRLVRNAIATIKKDVAESAEETLVIELERLDRRWRRIQAAHDKIEPRVKAGEDKAIVMMAKLDEREDNIQARRANFLGLDAPKKTQLDAKITGLGEFLALAFPTES